MTTFARPLLRHWLILAFLASAAMLAIAHAFQTFGGLTPCTLCLRQRDAYWWALGVSAGGYVLTLAPPATRLRPLVFAALALIFLAGAGIAAYHTGAEWKWWPGPQECSGVGGAVSLQSVKALLGGAKVSIPRCDEAAWRMLGLSMAGWNVLASLAFVGFSGMAATQGARSSQESASR